MSKYLRLLKEVIGNEISIESFEKEFLFRFKNETLLDNREYVILDELFGEVDCFCADPDLFEEGDIDESSLRKAIYMAIEKLEAL